MKNKSNIFKEKMNESRENARKFEDYAWIESETWRFQDEDILRGLYFAVNEERKNELNDPVYQKLDKFRSEKLSIFNKNRVRSYVDYAQSLLELRQMDEKNYNFLYDSSFDKILSVVKSKSSSEWKDLTYKLYNKIKGILSDDDKKIGYYTQIRQNPLKKTSFSGSFC